MISHKTARELIAELNDTDETESLEAKRASDAGRSVFETICAMSNEPDLNGGTILLGVEREELALFPAFVAVGVSNPDKIVADIASALSTLFNIPVRVDISQSLIDDKCIVRVDVPELARAQKPLYFKATGLPKGAFRRIGSTDQRCTEDDLYAFFQTKSQDSPDRSIVEDATWEDIDPAAVDAYRKARRELNELAEELNWPDDDLLHALNCVVRIGSKICITKAGLVSFGKSTALRRLDPSNRIDYIRIPGKTWVSDTEKFESLELRGPTLRTVGRVIASVLDDLPKAFRISDGSPQRSDVPIIPERVIREAVVNAVAHRNYQTFKPVQIIRYANRIEIRNPGYSLKSQERFDEPGSTLRNPHVAEILHETRYAETKGSGIRVMRQKMTESGLSEPTFISSREDDEFKVVFLFHHFLSESDWEWLSQFGAFTLDNEQLRALIFTREMGAVDNACYRNLNQVDTLAASTSLRRMKEVGLLESKGSGSRTYYVPGEHFRRVTGANMQGSELASMQGNADTMHAKNTSIVVSSASYRKLTGRRKRLEPLETEAIILDMCLHQPVSADEIAGVLGKSQNYVRNRFLYSMIQDGRLRYTIPDMVKHPGQKYTSAPREAGADAE